MGAARVNCLRACEMRRASRAPLARISPRGVPSRHASVDHIRNKCPEFRAAGSGAARRFERANACRYRKDQENNGV